MNGEEGQRLLVVELSLIDVEGRAKIQNDLSANTIVIIVTSKNCH